MVIIMINRSFVFLILLAAVTAVKLTSDSYVELAPQGYTFQVQDAKQPVQINVAGMPPGLAISNYTILSVGAVPIGQYILSVKANDATGSSDEKILILSVGSTFSSSSSSASTPVSSPPIPTPITTTTTETFTQTTSTSSSDRSALTDTSMFETSNSSISSMFGQSGGAASMQVISPSSGSVDSLQDYFNQIDVGSVSGKTGGSLSGSNLNAILTDFSNATDSTESHVVNVSAFATQNIVSQSSINLTFSDSQKSTVATDQANALFLQQKQASEYVAGNYSIVMQITANKNMLNELISNLTAAYQKDYDLSKQLGLQLSAASSNKSKIESALNNVNSYLASLKTQATASSSKLSQLQAQKQTLSGQGSQTSSAILQATQSVQSITAQIASANASLSSSTQSCSAIGAGLVQLNKSLSISSIQLDQVSQKLVDAAADVTSKQATVDDLARQLAQAQQALALAKNNSQSLQSQQADLQQTVSVARQDITVATQNLNSCTQQTTNLKQGLISLQANLTAAQTSLSQLSSQNSSTSNQINTLTAQISQETSNYNNIQTETANANSALALLQAALPAATATLKNLAQANAQAALNVQNDEATLQAAIDRFKKESASLEMATMHLQNARALSQKADQEVNTMLASRSNALPYAVAVSSPNNALIGQTIVAQGISISNWFNYLSANFGSAAFPYQDAAVSCLYPFTLSNLRSDVPCPDSSAQLQSVTGKLLSISSNEIIISVDGRSLQITILIPGCASLSSNVSNYRPSIGDSVIAKASSSNGQLVGLSLIFLRK